MSVNKEELKELIENDLFGDEDLSLDDLNKSKPEKKESPPEKVVESPKKLEESNVKEIKKTEPVIEKKEVSKSVEIEADDKLDNLDIDLGLDEDDDDFDLEIGDDLDIELPEEKETLIKTEARTEEKAEAEVKVKKEADVKKDKTVKEKLEEESLVEEESFELDLGELDNDEEEELGDLSVDLGLDDDSETDNFLGSDLDVDSTSGESIDDVLNIDIDDGKDLGAELDLDIEDIDKELEAIDKDPFSVPAPPSAVSSPSVSVSQPPAESSPFLNESIKTDFSFDSKINPPLESAENVTVPVQNLETEEAISEDFEEYVNVKPIEFPQLDEQITGKNFDLDFFSNIPVQIEVILGNTTISLKEIYELTEGSIIELDKIFGEPLELKINGQLIGLGEVVAVDNSYGIMLKEIEHSKS